jgi:ribosomal protein L40E
MKSKEMMEELLNDDGSTVNPEKIFVGPLSDEEKNYERYDIDKIYCPTSYRTLLKRIPSVFKLCDVCLGTHFFDELSSLAEKEKKEWEAIDAENKAAQDKAENEEIKKNLNMTDAEISEATSPDTPADADVMAEPPKRTRSSPATDVTSFPPEKIALLKGWQYLSDANKKRIQDITNVDGKVDIVWDRKDDLLRCDTCNAMSPEDATHCPVCGMKF